MMMMMMMMMTMETMDTLHHHEMKQMQWKKKKKKTMTIQPKLHQQPEIDNAKKKKDAIGNWEKQSIVHKMIQMTTKDLEQHYQGDQNENTEQQQR